MRMSGAGRWLVVSCFALLTACGGGGGGGSGGSAGGGGSDGGAGDDGGGSASPPSGSMSIFPSDTTLTIDKYAPSLLVINGALSPRPIASGEIFMAVLDDQGNFYRHVDVSGSYDQFGAMLQTVPWLESGTHVGTLTLQACQDPDCKVPFPGYSATIPYTVKVRPPAGEVHRLLPSALAVAFADTPTGSVLSRTLWVHDNFGVATSWSATSDSEWLTVTPTGTADASNLVFTANPALLPLGQTSVATVQISGGDAAGTTIKVGVWRDTNGAPQLQTVGDVAASSITGMARDPYRPLVYLSVGTGQILVYNAHTATLERTIDGVGQQLGRLAVSPDGGHLYAVDGQRGELLQVVDLDGNTPVATWNLGREGMGAEVLHPNGEDVVMVGAGYAAAHDAIVASPPTSAGVPVFTGGAATDDSRVVYSLSAIYPASAQLTAWWVDYSTGLGQLHAFPVTRGSPSGFELSDVQIAVSGDGDRLYVADSGNRSGDCAQIDPVDMTALARFASPAGSYPVGVATGAAGNVACRFTAGSLASEDDVHVFSPSGAAVASFATTNVHGSVYEQRFTVASSDGLVAVENVAGVGLVFVPMGGSSTQSNVQTKRAAPAGVTARRGLAGGLAPRH